MIGWTGSRTVDMTDMHLLFVLITQWPGDGELYWENGSGIEREENWRSADAWLALLR
jgi:hypothetical protein